jgi:hypothetical protein
MEQADRLMSSLSKDFTVVGQHRIHAWYAWAIIGIIVGMFIGLVYVANRSLQFNTGEAASRVGVLK